MRRRLCFLGGRVMWLQGAAGFRPLADRCMCSIAVMPHSAKVSMTTALLAVSTWICAAVLLNDTLEMCGVADVRCARSSRQTAPCGTQCVLLQHIMDEKHVESA
ncbi:unnamed protein product [Symbiodinium sp. CCMP2592]|nr:unnamed protein product [Symbiodinium sp. CCMP2592]